MEKHTDAGREPEHTSFSWMELTTGFWEEVSKILNAPLQPSDDKKAPLPDEQNALNDKYRTYETWKTGLKNLNSFIQMMTRQENREALSEAIVTFMEFMTQITGDSSENILEFQSQLLKSLSRIGQHTKAYSFDDIDHHIFESVRKLYETEFQKFHYIPKLGLSRYHLERFSILIDKFNIYYSHLNELIYLFFVPLDKTNRVMHAKVDELMKQRDFAADPDVFYTEWIKMLEGHYMRLLQSPEYTEALKKTINSLADYRKLKDEVLCQILKKLPIPTNEEMDDVYKELYQVKKQIRILSNQLNQITNP